MIQRGDENNHNDFIIIDELADVHRRKSIKISDVGGRYLGAWDPPHPISAYEDVPTFDRLLLTLVVDFGYDLLNSSDVGSMAQHVQDDVDVGASNFAIFLSVERVEALSQNLIRYTN